MECRICAKRLGRPDYSADGPALTDGGGLLDVRTEVYVCDLCGLAQSPDIPNPTHFYAHDYKISLQTADHDQLVTLGDGRSLFRTDVQAELVLRLAAPEAGSAVLDFGSGKSATLRKLIKSRPDLKPFVFDVSDDYRASWADWVPTENCATHVLPETWRGKFNLIMCHFVLEHTVSLSAVLANLVSLLSPEGLLFLSVPNTIANPGDLLVADHLSHFTRGSLSNALMMSGLQPVQIDAISFPGALLSVSRARNANVSAADIIYDPEAVPVRQVASEWASIKTRILEIARLNSGKPAAIYGAGFYGSFIRSILGAHSDVRCFVDANPHLQGSTHMGLPVLQLSSMPEEIRIIYAGLNPRKAKSILGGLPDLKERTIVWLQ